jgi:hypothetical protein
VTQLPFPSPLSPLAARVLAWAREHGPARFRDLTDDMPGVNASDVDHAAKEAGVLRWVGGEGHRGRFDVCAVGAEGVES